MYTDKHNILIFPSFNSYRYLPKNREEKLLIRKMEY